MDTFIFYYTIRFYELVGPVCFQVFLCFNIVVAIILGGYVYEKFK